MTQSWDTFIPDCQDCLGWEKNAKKLENEIRLLEEQLADACKAGIIEGMTRFAWWNNGVEQVGTCGTTLKQAIADLEKEMN